MTWRWIPTEWQETRGYERCCQQLALRMRYNRKPLNENSCFLVGICQLFPPLLQLKPFLVCLFLKLNVYQIYTISGWKLLNLWDIMCVFRLQWKLWKLHDTLIITNLFVLKERISTYLLITFKKYCREFVNQSVTVHSVIVYNGKKNNGTVFRMLPGLLMDLTKTLIKIRDHNQCMILICFPFNITDLFPCFCFAKWSVVHATKQKQN